MFLTKLAFKNLMRHRNRTLITAAIIAFSLFFYLFLDSMIGGMTEMSYRNIIEHEAGHLQVVNQEYREKEEKFPLENLITPGELTGEIENIEGYRASSPELNFRAKLTRGERELPVVGKGITPEKFNRVFSFEDQFTAGSMFSAGEEGAVVGRQLADQMKLEVGDYITLLVRDKNNAFNTIETEISGLIYTGNPAVNNSYVYLPLETVQQALAAEDRVSKIIISLADKDRAPAAAGELSERLDSTGTELSVIPWEELEAVSVAGAKQMGNQLIMAIILLIAAIAVVNTVILAALERMREIGMMKAMGLTTREIIYTFVLESTGIGILGGVIGLIMGAGSVWFLATFGIDFEALFNLELGSFGVPIIGKLYGVWNPGSFVLVFCFGVAVSLVSSILPAYWAAAREPVDAIEHR